MIAPEEVRVRLKSAFPDADIDVMDLTGAQDNYQARVVSNSFAGKSLPEQHHLVYRALGDIMQSALTALSLRTYTPHDWALMRGAR